MMFSMTKYKLTATAIPAFVTEASATLQTQGDQPLFKFTLKELEPVIKTWLWQLSQPEVSQEQPKEPEKYLTRRDMANLLRLSLVTLDKYIANGTIRSKKLGRRILFEPGECDRVMGMMANNTFKR